MWRIYKQSSPKKQVYLPVFNLNKNYMYQEKLAQAIALKEKLAVLEESKRNTKEMVVSSIFSPALKANYWKNTQQNVVLETAFNEFKKQALIACDLAIEEVASQLETLFK